MKLGIEELSIIVEGLRLRVKQLSSSVTEINQSIENLETEDGQKAPAIMQTTSPAAIASFADGGEDMPIKSLKCTIVPVQAGTGDPAPDNVRPITGWDGVTVTRTGTGPADTVSKSVNFPQTVYGGWIDVIKGELHVTHGYALLNDASKWTTYTGTVNFAYNQDFTDRKRFANSYTGLTCTYINIANGQEVTGRWVGATSDKFGIKNSQVDIDTIKADATAGRIAILYDLAEETILPIDPVTITTLLGSNNVYCDTGTVEVVYAADTKMYIDNAIAAVTPEPEPEPSPEQDDAPPEEEEEEEAEPAPEEDTAEPEEVEEEEAAEEEEAVPVVKKSTRKK